MSRHSPNAARKRDAKARLMHRHGARCFYCRTAFTTPADATLDHYIPYALWRTWWVPNLVVACVDCNQVKGDRLPWPLVWLLLASEPTPSPVGVSA